MIACCDFVSDQCLEVGNDNALPSFQDYGNTGERINRYHQAIIPSYEFQCCGEITEWGVDVESGGGRDNRRYTLNFQVWRPSPSSSSEYYLVGNNRFSAISLSGNVAEVTPSPQDYIQFRPGDVLGIYVEEARVNDDNKGVVVLTDSSFTSELVWQASIATSQAVGCPVSVGSSGDLNTMIRGAPVISIETGE